MYMWTTLLYILIRTQAHTHTHTHTHTAPLSTMSFWYFSSRDLHCVCPSGRTSQTGPHTVHVLRVTSPLVVDNGLVQCSRRLVQQPHQLCGTEGEGHRKREGGAEGGGKRWAILRHPEGKPTGDPCPSLTSTHSSICGDQAE